MPAFGAIVKSAAAFGGKVAKDVATQKAKDFVTAKGKGKGGGDMTFNQAFAKARKEKGPTSTFSYKGKMYSTATMEDVKKAGFDNLKDYLNAKKK